MGGARRGIVIPLVVLALVLFGLFATTLLRSGQGEYRLASKTVERERAKLLAQAGISKAAALIYQNTFEDRWYKQVQGPHGWVGTLEGLLGEGPDEGYYKVVAEDVANELPPDWVGNSPEAKAKRIEGLTYNRIDLFAEGVFGNSRILLYQAIVLLPEEKVYAYDVNDDGVTKTFTNVTIR